MQLELINRLLLSSPDAQQQGLYLVCDERVNEPPVYLHNGVSVLGIVVADQARMVRQEIRRVSAVAGHVRVLVVGIDQDYLRNIRNGRRGVTKTVWDDHNDGTFNVTVHGHCAERPARKHGRKEAWRAATYRPQLNSSVLDALKEHLPGDGDERIQLAQHHWIGGGGSDTAHELDRTFIHLKVQRVWASVTLAGPMRLLKLLPHRPGAQELYLVAEKQFTQLGLFLHGVRIGTVTGFQVPGLLLAMHRAGGDISALACAADISRLDSDNTQVPLKIFGAYAIPLEAHRIHVFSTAEPGIDRIKAALTARHDNMAAR